MKWFSERKGLKKSRTEIQVDSMDEALRNRLWNVLESHYIRPMLIDEVFLQSMQNVMVEFYDSYLKQKTDSAPYVYSGIRKELRVFFTLENWSTIYDFLEFLVAHFHTKQVNDVFMKECNAVLESELSAYRFVGGLMTQVTSKEEISEIEKALETPFETVNAHIENALKLMSDKKSPDPRNSIKESISAVEAICRLITKKKNATLGDALDIIEREGKIELHGALKKAFDSLYGYTSSAEGIRHALTEEKVTLSFEDAKFMLVSCSAFVNFLISKASKAGIKMSQLK